MDTNSMDFGKQLSLTMTKAVEMAGNATVLVAARKRLPFSGIVIQPGLVLTVEHGIEKEEDIPILGANGQRSTAVVIGKDAGTDLAVLRLSEPIGTVATPAGASIGVGLPVLAIGRPDPDGIQASFGIVTGEGTSLRTMRGAILERFLSTDATPYPGFSGGPLANLSGQVVGVNTSGLVGGMSLAIPAGLAWKVAGLLAEHGKLKRGFLGIRSQKVSIPAEVVPGQKTGLLVVGLEESGPAEKAGWMVGDILVSLNQLPVSDQDDLMIALTGDLAGRETVAGVLRGGVLTSLSVAVGER